MLAQGWQSISMPVLPRILRAPSVSEELSYAFTYIYIRYIYIYDFSLEQFRFEPCMDENGSTLTNSLVHSVNPVSYLSLFQIY